MKQKIKDTYDTGKIELEFLIESARTGGRGIRFCVNSSFNQIRCTHATLSKVVKRPVVLLIKGKEGGTIVPTQDIHDDTVDYH